MKSWKKNGRKEEEEEESALSLRQHISLQINENHEKFIKFGF